jgi:hypothetical protein
MFSDLVEAMTDNQPSNSSTQPFDVFLSHNTEDKPSVEQLARRLEEERLTAWLDKWDLVPGDDAIDALEKALGQSRACAVFLGPAGIGPWQKEERQAALRRRVRDKNFRVIPVLLPGATLPTRGDLPDFLFGLVWVDFRTKGLQDNEEFHRLVAGIRGLPPGRRLRQPIPPAPPAGSVFSRFWKRLVAGRQPNQSGELKKIIIGAVVALLLSAPFISAAIPRYKLQIKSPAFKKDGVYEVPTGVVIIKWGMMKEQWFRETDISDSRLLRANLTISKIGDAQEQSFPDQPGELKTNLKSGKYEVRIDAVGYQRTETFALQVGGATQETVELSGTVFDQAGNRIQGAQVTIDDMPGMKPVETSTDGIFTITEIPKPHGAMVRIRVSKEGHLPNPRTDDVVLGATPPRVVLRRGK